MRAIAIYILAVISLSSAKNYGDYGLIPFNGGQYLLSSFQSTWVEANKFCKSIGFALVDVDTEEKNEFILDVFGSAIPDRVWIGGSDLGSEGEYYWGQSLQPFNFTLWHDGEPTGNNPNTGVKEDCIHYRNINSTIMWNDAQCDYQYQFICEVIANGCKT